MRSPAVALALLVAAFSSSAVNARLSKARSPAPPSSPSPFSSPSPRGLEMFESVPRPLSDTAILAEDPDEGNTPSFASGDPVSTATNDAGLNAEATKGINVGNNTTTTKNVFQTCFQPVQDSCKPAN